MTGAFGSVIGMKPEEVIRRFMTKRRVMVQQSKDNPGVSFVVITINDQHKATNIERHRYAVTGLDVDEGELD